MTIEDRERIAKLEAIYDGALVYRERREELEAEHHKKQDETLRELSKVVNKMHDKIEKQRSFVGGIIFVFSSVFSVIVLFKDRLFE